MYYTDIDIINMLHFTNNKNNNNTIKLVAISMYTIIIQIKYNFNRTAAITKYTFYQMLFKCSVYNTLIYKCIYYDYIKKYT